MTPWLMHKYNIVVPKIRSQHTTFSALLDIKIFEIFLHLSYDLGSTG